MDNNKIEFCRKIYREAFNDDDIYFEELLFENCFEYIKTFDENGIPVSMYFALPCLFKSGDSEKEAVYFYAAATDKKYRGRGYMGKLIEELKNSENIIFLRPAEKSLINYYKKFGFDLTDCVCDYNDVEIIPTDGFKKLTDKIKIDINYEKFILMYFSKSKISKIKFPFSMF